MPSPWRRYAGSVPMDVIATMSPATAPRPRAARSSPRQISAYPRPGPEPKTSAAISGVPRPICSSSAAPGASTTLASPSYAASSSVFVITAVAPSVCQPRAASSSSSRFVTGPARATSGLAPRASYQAWTAASAASVPPSGAVSASTEFARREKPSA